MNDIAVDLYLRMKEAVTGRKSRDQKRREEAQITSNSRPFEKGRDPVSVGDSLSGLLGQFDWDADLAKAELFTHWIDLVGQQTALNSTPEELVNGQLVVRCKTTSWATQLRLMHTQMLAKITQDYPDAKVTEIKFIGPDAPSWKKGKLSVPGRGPRDTYG